MTIPDRAELRRSVLLALLLASALVMLDLARTSTKPLNLVQPGLRGPSAELFERDFPDSFIPDSVGLDGQQYYAIARSPFDLDDTAQHLDRPRYRLQRPLLPWLAWLGHPSGGGNGLIASFAVVGLASIALLAHAIGSITVSLGGRPWPAAAVGLFPGVWWSLRVTVADTLATALALACVALLLRDRVRPAVAAACAAVLAKETAAVLLTGWLIADWRDGKRWRVVASSFGLALAWACYLRWRLPGSESIGELTVPLAGLVGAVRDRWLEGHELWGLLAAALALATAAAALARAGWRHPLGPAIVVQLAFLSVANADVIGNDFGAGRATLPLLAVSLVAWATPDAPVRLRDRREPINVGG